MTNVDQANTLALTYLLDLPQLADAIVEKDRDFFLSGLNAYSFKVILDEENAEKKEPVLGTLMGVSLFNKCVYCSVDLLIHYLHVMAHEKCSSFWKKIRVPYNDFTEKEINFFEELYNQRLLEVVAPVVSDDFYKIICAYDETVEFKNPILRKNINTLFTSHLNQYVPSVLITFKRKLARLDPLEVSTFYWAASYFHNLFKSNSFHFRELVKSYEQV
jgi:hypothetical protein